MKPWVELAKLKKNVTRLWKAWSSKVIFSDFLKISEDLKPKNKRLLIAGKCVRQQFDVDAKFCCVKSPGDGSGPGVIAADAGTPKGGTTCPGHSLEICIKTCPSSNACIYGACIRDCTKKCADDIDDCIDDTPDEYDY